MLKLPLLLIVALFSLYELVQCQLVIETVNCPWVVDQIEEIEINLEGCSEKLHECLMDEFAENDSVCTTCIIISKDLQRESMCNCLQCLVNTLATRCYPIHCRDKESTRKLLEFNSRFDNSLPRALPLVPDPVDELVILSDAHNILRRGIFKREREQLIKELMQMFKTNEESIYDAGVEVESTEGRRLYPRTLSRTIYKTITTWKYSSALTLPTYDYMHISNMRDSENEELNEEAPTSGIRTGQLTEAETGFANQRVAKHLTNIVNITLSPEDVKNLQRAMNSSVFHSRSNTFSESKAFLVSIGAATFAIFGVLAISNMSTSIAADPKMEDINKYAIELDNVFHPDVDDSDINDLADSDEDSELLSSLAVPIPYSGVSAASLANAIHMTTI